MRPLRRSRYVSPALVPVVDDGYGVEPSANDPEIRSLRQEERDWAKSGLVVDWVVYRIISEPDLGLALKVALYREGIARFSKWQSPEEIRVMIDVAIRFELLERHRRAEAARKAEDSARRSAVLLSAQQSGPG